MAELELIDVCKAFGSKRVVDGISLVARARDFLVVLGPSGCGKSTLLRLLAGLESIDSGAITIDGRRVDHLTPAERDAAMVFQHYALYPNMSVRENLSFGLENMRLRPHEVSIRVAAAATTLEIEHLLDRYPRQISGGERQRVALGRAMVKRPRLFLCDEPLSSLDASLRGRTRLKIAQLHQQINSTMVFVTHDQLDAMTLATRVAVMNSGKLEQIGTPMEVYTRPATPFVAAFVGTPAMNLLPAEISAAADGSTIVRLPGGAELETTIQRADLPDHDDFTFGIRAEDISLCDAHRAHALARATFIERLGSRTLIHVEFGAGRTVIVEEHGVSHIAVGDSVGLKFNVASAHLFDASRGYHTPDSTRLEAPAYSA